MPTASAQELAWLQLPAAGPSPRYVSAAAYDMRRDRFVLHGGRDSTRAFDELWEFDGSAWIPRGSGGPGRNWDHAMAFDEPRGVCVLVTGAPQGPTGWTWNGSAWQPISSPATVRWGHSMSDDPRRGLVHFHGGYGRTDTGPVSDHSVWDGTRWNRLFIETMPGRMYHGFAYDMNRDRMVVAGGFDGLGAVYGDTWEWDGSAWTQSLGTSKPGLRRGPSMV